MKEKPIFKHVYPNVKVVITPHAVQRFQERSGKIGRANLTVREAIERIERYLNSSVQNFKTPEKHRVLRIIQNGFKETEYWVFNGWRFVIEKQGNKLTLKTCERTKVIQN
jgi:hypothetical protein